MFVLHFHKKLYTHKHYLTKSFYKNNNLLKSDTYYLLLIRIVYGRISVLNIKEPSNFHFLKKVKQ